MNPGEVISGFLPCPFCGTPVSIVETLEAYRHAGSIRYATVVVTNCNCWQEYWRFTGIGSSVETEAEARLVWNGEPSGRPAHPPL